MSLTSDEFWSHTWREVAALSDILRSKIRREDERAALICHTVARLWSTNPPEFEAFMPTRGVPQPHTPVQPLPDDVMTAKINSIMRKLGGAKPEEKQ